jgi:hypothetical protein
MKVSFDFDGTLEMESVQEYAADLIKRGLEVWVVTSRFGDDELYRKFFQTSTNVDLSNRDLRKVTDKLGIPEERIHFTNMKDKWRFIENMGFIWHLDDDWIENEMINIKTLTKGINIFGNRNWKRDCDSLI